MWKYLVLGLCLAVPGYAEEPFGMGECLAGVEALDQAVDEVEGKEEELRVIEDLTQKAVLACEAGRFEEGRVALGEANGLYAKVGVE